MPQVRQLLSYLLMRYSLKKRVLPSLRPYLLKMLSFCHSPRFYRHFSLFTQPYSLEDRKRQTRISLRGLGEDWWDFWFFPDEGPAFCLWQQCGFHIGLCAFMSPTINTRPWITDLQQISWIARRTVRHDPSHGCPLPILLSYRLTTLVLLKHFLDCGSPANYVIRQRVNPLANGSLFVHGSTHSQITLNTDPLTKSACDSINFCPTRLASTF